MKFVKIEECYDLMLSSLCCAKVISMLVVMGRKMCALLLLGPGRSAKYCDKRVCLFACLSVCLSAGTSQNHIPEFTKFFVHVICVVARSSSDDNAIRYVLPVLWMTSRLPIMSHMMRV